MTNKNYLKARAILMKRATKKKYQEGKDKIEKNKIEKNK